MLFVQYKNRTMGSILCFQSYYINIFTRLHEDHEGKTKQNIKAGATIHYTKSKS